MASSLVYQPLRAGEIRLLRLEWATNERGQRVHPGPDSAIRCSITNHRLDACPHYCALSYTWGIDSSTYDLQVGSGQTKIQKNLYSFLAQALPDSPRSSTGGREVGYIWIDALCINQKDDVEKVVQIALMARIYALASRIVIWLGDARSGSDLAMDFYSRTSMLWATNQLSGDGRSFPVSDAERLAIEHLTRREYWERSWIYQEATTPSVAREVWCGSKMIRFDALCVINALAHKHMLNLGVVLEPSPWNRRVSLLNELSERRKQADKSLTMLSLLHLTQGLEATNPSDKVYALLNIFGDVHKLDPSRLPFSPSYGTPVENVFRDVAVFILETTRELDMLLFCSLGQFKKLKSWVPNFYRFTYTILGFTYLEFFSAGGRSSPRFSIDQGNGRLRVYGVRNDTVQAVVRPLIYPGQRGAQMADKAFWQPVFTAWTRALANVIFPKPVRDRPYVSGGTTCEALDWVLSAGMSAGYGSLQRDQDIPHWPIMEQAASGDTPEISAEGRAFHDLVLRTCNQSFFVTSRGYIGFGDADAGVGDVLVVIPGLAIPMLLRPLSEDAKLWRVVGPCLVKGVMDGEVLNTHFVEREFVLT